MVKGLKGHVVKSGLLKSLLVGIGLCGTVQAAFGEADTVRCVPDEETMCAIFKQGGTSHLMSFGRSVIQDYLDECRSDNFDSCVDVGNILSQAVGKDRDLKTAAQVLGKACLAENPKGCFELGQMLWESTDRKDEAFEAMSRGCELGSVAACLYRAVPMEDGVGGRPEEAFQIYGDLCENGSLDACQRQAMLLKQGKGVAKDSARATDLFERLCEGGMPAACFRLANMHFDGEARPNDPIRVNALLSYACQESHADACGFLGITMLIANNNEITEPAKQAITKGCELGSTLSCDFIEQVTSRD